MTSNQKNGSRKGFKKKFSKIFRSKSRKYTKSTNSFSEKRRHPIRINGLVNLDVLKKDNNSTIQQNLEVYSKANKVFKLSRNSSGLNSNQINDNSVTIESRKCPSSNLNNTQEVSASLLGVADPLQREDNSDIRRPVIKSKFQNYVRNSSNKSLLSFDANLKINLGDLAKERLKICKNNDFKIPNQRCSELKLAYRQKTSSSNYSSIYKTVDNDCGRNNSSMSSQYYGAKHKVLPANKVVYRDFKRKMLKLKNIQKLGSRRDSSKRLVKLQKIDKNNGNSLRAGQKRLNRSSTMKENSGKNYHSNHLVNRTIEYHEKTMIEEYTNTSIPEFTLGPDTFLKDEPPKPLSVNRMGFYEDCRSLEACISPIKQCSEVVQENILNLNLEEVKKLPEESSQKEGSDENEFYDNNGVLSGPSSDKQDSTKKYIELVDSFRNGGRTVEFETPSFKIQTEETQGKKQCMKFEEIIKEENKSTQRSSNLLNSFCRNSSEIQSQRKSTATQAETDAIDSFRPNHRSFKNPKAEFSESHKAQSSKEICIPNSIARLEGRNASLRLN
ncbi:unnamed protein product [Moneuplotes crassus]|uniref:Uncharacterized protein n=1 Tax=Euplotes crassus TaxID=5936 RepID=A0AAD2DAV0_EUPCR|nr:unnamed protein product [Moneuplotes crassus]